MAKTSPAPERRSAPLPAPGKKAWQSRKTWGAGSGLAGASAAVFWLPPGSDQWGVLAALFLGALPGLLLIVAEAFLDWQSMVLGVERPPRRPAERQGGE